MGSKELLVGNGTLASSLGIEILTVGFDMVGKVNGTSCASIPPSIGAKVEKGSLNGAGGALGIGGLPALRVPSLKLAAFGGYLGLPHLPLLFHSHPF